MPIKSNLRFNTSRQQRGDKYAIISPADDEFGSSFSLQSSAGKGLAAAPVMDISKRHTDASATVTTSPSAGRQWGLYQAFPDAVTSIVHSISDLWTSARSNIGSALNKMRRRKQKCGEIWTVRISTEYTDASSSPNGERKDRKSFSEMDFESKEDAELRVYQWNNQTVHTKDGNTITYKAVLYLKGSGGNDGTFLPLAAPTTGNGNAIYGVVNLDCSEVEAGENTMQF